MNRKFFQTSILLLGFVVSACGSTGSPSKDELVDMQAVIDLVCGLENQVDCVPNICENAKKFPLLSALTNKAVNDFVNIYSECEGFNTPAFSLELGIGKCIEYQILEISSGSRVTFRVSENCSFRNGSPSGICIAVEINSGTLKFESIHPSVEYIENPLYCRTDADCYCLSGSGLHFLACQNFFVCIFELIRLLSV